MAFSPLMNAVADRLWVGKPGPGLASTDANGKVAAHGTVSATELGYLDGVTSAIQTQLNGKAASSHTHSATELVNFAFKDGVVAATTAALSATYANGSSGVGAKMLRSISRTRSIPSCALLAASGGAR